jgi:hypothetical protein
VALWRSRVRSPSAPSTTFLARSEKNTRPCRKPRVVRASLYADEHGPELAERMPESSKKSNRKSPEEPPGDFLSDHFRDDTSRFLDEVKRQIKRRKELDSAPKLGPPKRRKR